MVLQAGPDNPDTAVGFFPGVFQLAADPPDCGMKEEQRFHNALKDHNPGI